MKQILIISTGGTICSRLVDGCRRLTPDVSESTLLKNFYNNEKYASLTGGIFENSDFPTKTLSENMTFELWEKLISHLKGIDTTMYSGIVILHGTDTLAYTASLLSMVLSDCPIPVMLVSGDAPPDMETSNANANFAKAVECILDGIAPNVYIPYRNSDGRMQIHIGSRVMQSPNFSSDFRSVGELDFEKASKERKALPFEISYLDASVLLVFPYVNLNYKKIDLDGVTAVAHGSYHSGTFCTVGGRYSISALAESCIDHDIPLFVAPCTLGDEQYESVFSAVSGGSIIPVSMTIEMLYIKLTLAVSAGLHGSEISSFVKTSYNNEIC